MIALKFNSIIIENFQSIANAELDFTNLGICYVKGINEYDSKTRSNGSGKSSLVTALYWVLYGKTPAGITNQVLNKFTTGDCKVTLNMDVDGINYSIIREVNIKLHSTLTILKNGEEISGRNKTDSEKIIQDIVRINDEIFLQTVLLAQGFANRFATYTPKARKELLENMYGIDNTLNDLIESLKVKEIEYKTKLNEIERKIISTNTQLAEKNNRIKELALNIVEFKNILENVKNTKYNISEKELQDLQQELQTFNDNKNIISAKIDEQYKSIVNVDRDINDKKNEIKGLYDEINSFKDNKVCPTCGTLLEDYSKNEHLQKHLKDVRDKINQNEATLKLLTSNIQDLRFVYDKMLSKKTDIEQKIKLVNNTYQTKLHQYQDEIKKDSEIQHLENRINESHESRESLKALVEQLNEALNGFNITRAQTANKLDIIQHCTRIVNNQFRGYLLANIIDSLNDKLHEISLSLFENEIITINSDKLNITLDDKLYEQCSGGERSKINIALIIAQKFVAESMNAIRSNILICDEIFDGCDDVVFATIMDLINDEFCDAESTFIISHRDMSEIPFDKIITVVKNRDQISHVSL